MNRLKRRAWVGNVLTLAVMGVVLFVCAGTVRYWQGWLYLAIFLAISILVTLFLLKRDPALLERRLKGGPAAEKGTVQRIVMTLASLGFVGLIAVAGLDRRFGWSQVPLPLVFAGDAMTLLGFYLTFLVLRVNTFASATIQVTEDQRVITTGPYAVVRHPMYSGGLIYLVGMPLALGSYRALLVFAVMFPVLLWRLFDEEKLLARSLPGYVEYQAKVPWRLIPKVF